MTLEIDIENACVLIAASVGVPSAKLDNIHRSWPDRCFFIPMPVGPWIVEFKLPGEKPRKQQIARLEMFEALNYPTDVVDSIDLFTRLFFERFRSLPES